MFMQSNLTRKLRCNTIWPLKSTAPLPGLRSVMLAVDGYVDLMEHRFAHLSRGECVDCCMPRYA